MKSDIFKTFFLSLCVIANTHFAYGQTASILPQGYTQYLDNNGKPLSAGKVYNYIPNTTTPKTTWQDAAETTPNANPVILDAGGRARILGDGSYRQIVRDRNNNLIWDAVTSSAGSGGSGPTATGDGDLVGTLKPWAGVTAPNQYQFAYGQELSRTTFSALFTAITSTQAAFCTSGSPTITGLADTTNFWIGMSLEISCVAAGFSTVVSKTSSSITMAANANVSTNTNATFFPWGRGNGTTTFNAPDMRGVVPAGNNNMGGTASANLTTTYFAANPNSIGALGGAQSQQLTTNHIPTLGIYNTNEVVISSTSSANDYARTSGLLTINGAAGAYGQVLSNSGAQISDVDSTGTLPFATLFSATVASAGSATSASIGNGGTGYTNGAQTFTVSGGTCTTQPQFTITVAGGVLTGPVVLLTAGDCSVAPANPASVTGGGAGTGARLNVGYTGAPFSRLQPTRTTNYIVKVTPDSNSASASGVTSLGGMTGDIACGTGLTCTGNIISVSPDSQSEAVYDTKAIAQSASVPASVQSIRTLGYSTVGDNGGGSYIKVGSGPATVYRFQTADGAWWALNNRAITPEQFACKGDGVTNDTVCWNDIGTFLTAVNINPPVLNNRVGAIYQIWPNGSAPSTLMTLDSLVGFTWNFQGSRFRTNQVFAAAYGVAVISHAKDWIINDPWYESTAWVAPLSPLLGAIFLAVQEGAAPWSQGIVINNMRMTGGVGGLRVTSTNLGVPATATGGEAANFVINNAYFENVMYPMNFQSTGDNFVGNNIRVKNVGRAYFPANVSNHKVDITSEPATTAGTLQQVDFAVYPYPNAALSRRSMSNIDVTYRLADPGTFANGEVSAASFIQVVPRATISAAASCGANCTRLTVNTTANMLSGQQWYCSGATGTTAINGFQTITVQSGTTVDVPVTFVATSGTGYCTVSGFMRNIKVNYDVTNTGASSGTPLMALYRYDEVPVTDTFDRGYEISNFEISGRLVNFNNGVTPAFRLFSPALGTWTGDTVNNFSIRDFVMSGVGSVSISGPANSSTINLENIVSTGGTSWVLGGSASAFNIMNVNASGVTDRSTVADSAAPANQFANGVTSGAIQYAQVNFSNLAGTATYSQIQNAGALCVLGRATNSSGVLADICTTSGSNAILRENGGGVLNWGVLPVGAITNGSLTYAKIQNVAALSVFGRASNSAGVGADISAVAGSDCAFRESASTLGCGTLTATATPQLATMRVKLTGVNFNAANNDNAITLPLPSGYSRYVVERIYVGNVSASITTATAGMFSAAGGGGTTLVTTAAMTVSTAAANTANNNQILTGTNAWAFGVASNFTSAFFRTVTPQGSAATGDVTIIYTPIQ